MSGRVVGWVAGDVAGPAESAAMVTSRVRAIRMSHSILPVMSTAGGFFDFRDNLAARKAPRPQPAPTPSQAAPSAAAMTVSEITNKIDRALRTGLPPHVLVKGEISNLKQG